MHGGLVRALLLVAVALGGAGWAEGEGIRVVVNLVSVDGRGEEGFILKPEGLQVDGLVSVMDNSDVEVRICGQGTFSADQSGVCVPCGRCDAETYEVSKCVHTHDVECAACTRCGVHEYEACACNYKGGRCVSGDRVCIQMVPASVALRVALKTTTFLTDAQSMYVEGALRIWFIEWLVYTFLVTDVQYKGMSYTGNLTYVAKFQVDNVYDPETAMQLRSGDVALMQKGLEYTFSPHAGPGARRRLLAWSPLQNIVVTGTEGSCADVDLDVLAAQCGAHTTFVRNYETCTGECMPDPCAPGTTGDLGRCVACPERTFKDVAGAGNCSECGEGLWSAAGSISGDNCTAVIANLSATTSTSTSATTSTSASATTSAAGGGALIGGEEVGCLQELATVCGGGGSFVVTDFATCAGGCVFPATTSASLAGPSASLAGTPGAGTPAPSASASASASASLAGTPGASLAGTPAPGAGTPGASLAGTPAPSTSASASASASLAGTPGASATGAVPATGGTPAPAPVSPPGGSGWGWGWGPSVSVQNQPVVHVKSSPNVRVVMQPPVSAGDPSWAMMAAGIFLFGVLVLCCLGASLVAECMWMAQRAWPPPEMMHGRRRHHHATRHDSRVAYARVPRDEIIY